MIFYVLLVLIFVCYKNVADFQQWRLVCLAVGLILLLLAPTVSRWVPFYYSTSMAIGIFLVIIILLFQVYKLLSFHIWVSFLFPSLP